MQAAPVSPRIRIQEHIRRALDAGAPVVALESSVFAQGLPSPHNGHAARRMTSAVEHAGAIAAITAVVCGFPSVGMEAQDLARFLRGEGVRKVSARDLSAAIAQRADGATTVAGALALASIAGIRTLATGGIGGVHRTPPDQPASRDESADLLELATTPMVVVCAGAKAILDLESTFERLDTLGIPVVGVGTDEFPAFFTASSGIPLSVSVSTAAEAASIASAHFALGRQQAVLVVQPPPANVALDPRMVDEAVAAALQRAVRDGIRGGAVTPYLLVAVARESGGRTLDTNLGLLEANARLAGEIAVSLASGS